MGGPFEVLCIKGKGNQVVYKDEDGECERIISIKHVRRVNGNFFKKRKMW